MSLLGPDGRPAPFESLVTLNLGTVAPAGAADMAELQLRRQALTFVADNCGWDPVTLWFAKPRVIPATKEGTVRLEVRLNIVAERAEARYGAAAAAAGAGRRT